MRPEQAKAWSRLVSAVRRAANAGTLEKREAAARAIRAALGSTWKARGANDALAPALVRLLGLARGYLAMSGELRRENAEPMRKAAAEAAQALKGGGRPAIQSRAFGAQPWWDRD